MKQVRQLFCFSFLTLFAFALPVAAQQAPAGLDVHWDKVESVSKTTATLQVVVNPPLRPGQPVRDGAYKALKELGADYVRYVPWLPYPRLGVAELEPPTDGKTSWDFTLIDPMTIDFLEATKGHPSILNFSTIPQWMYKTDKPVKYPDDPNLAVWDYEQGTELRDPSCQEVADYFARLVGWYTAGGFTDELGQRHDSGLHYPLAYWEVLNEVEFEHKMSPQTYTTCYDATVTAIHKVSPATKFVGTALAIPGQAPDFLEYFLNPANHKPGVPLDFVSYHFYAVPTADQSPEVQNFTFWDQAAGFLNTVRYIETMRKRLSPNTRTTIDEIGAISADDIAQAEPGHVAQPIPNSYWNLTSAMYAYLFKEVTRMGIDVVGESQLVGYPTQFPSVSMVRWDDGSPNPRFRTLELLKNNFGVGDKIVEIAPFTPFAASHPYLESMAVVTPEGKHRVLLINKRDRPLDVKVRDAKGAKLEYIDQTTGFGPALTGTAASDTVTLGGFSVTVVTLP